MSGDESLGHRSYKQVAAHATLLLSIKVDATSRRHLFHEFEASQEFFSIQFLKPEVRQHKIHNQL